MFGAIVTLAIIGVAALVWLGKMTIEIKNVKTGKVTRFDNTK